MPSAQHELPYEARLHLGRTITHLRALHPSIADDEAWDPLLLSAIYDLSADVRSWLPGLSRAREGAEGGERWFAGVGEKEEGKRREKGRAGSRVASPARPAFNPGPDTLEWVRARLGASSAEGGAEGPLVLVLTFPPPPESYDAHAPKRCSWLKGAFHLPDEGELVFPVAVPEREKDSVRVVGGSVVLSGTGSEEQEGELRALVRAAIYTLLSLILESALLDSLHIPHSPTPAPSPPTQPAALPPPTPQPTPPAPAPLTTKHKRGPSKLWTLLLHPRSHSPIQSAQTDHPPLPPPKDPPRAVPSSSSSSSKSTQAEPEPRFARLVRLLRELPLDTSPNIKVPVPSVLLELAAKERKLELLSPPPAPPAERTRKRTLSRPLLPSLTPAPAPTPSPPPRPALRLTGVEKAALRSLRVGDVERLEGWVGAQGACWMVSRWTYDASSSSPVPSHIGWENGKGKEEEEGTRRFACVPPHWRTVSFGGREDGTLGQVLGKLGRLGEGEGRCANEKCAKAWGGHVWGWGCAGRRVEVRVGRRVAGGSGEGGGGRNEEGPGDGEEGKRNEEEREKAEEEGQSVKKAEQETPTSPTPPKPIRAWLECSICGTTSKPAHLSPGASLLSFAKYIDLLLFSPPLRWPALCEHTRQPPDPQASSQDGTPATHRFVGEGRGEVTFSLVPLPLYTLDVPLLQLSSPIPSTLPAPDAAADADEERREVLRQEIAAWFGHAKRWARHLELALMERKKLPRRPHHRESSDSGLGARSLSPHHHGGVADAKFDVSASASASAATVLKDLALTASLRASLHTDETAIAADLKGLQPLNDVRRRFVAMESGLRRKMGELEGRWGEVVGRCAWEKPAWAGGEGDGEGGMVLPGSWVVVREREVGSIIAYTLSSVDYKRALSDPRATQLTGTSSQSQDVQPSLSPSLSPSTPPESWSAVVSRRENPRDVAALLTMQVRGSKMRLNGSPSQRSAGGGSREGSPAGKLMLRGTPRDAWAAPDLGVSLQSARGDLHAADDVLVEKLLQDMEGDSAERLREVEVGIAAAGEGAPQRPSVTSMSSATGKVLANSLRSGSTTSSPETRASITSTLRSRGSSNASDATILPPIRRVEAGSVVLGPTPASPTPSQPSMSSINDVLRFVSSTTRSLLFGASDSVATSLAHLPLLAVDRARSLPAIDERPHIRYDWSVGKRLKFSCTVYYAEQFEALRKLCGVDGVFVESVAECVEWKAEGGRSRSSFFKSKDDRFIIKSLVNAWHVSDLQVLLDVAPIFFDYIDSMGDRPSTLAKLLGFFSIEVKNLDTTSQSKVDVLVMENLFFNQRVDARYDLKGIEVRRVKGIQGTSGRTLFDAEWMEEQRRNPMVVPAHSGMIIHEALKEDAAFLTRSNIMDYSMLLGVDHHSQHVRCGLVDTIGSYNVAKTLEYTAKQSLKSGKDVTVIPPAEYEARFVRAMETYFVSCPDKWTKPPSKGVGLPASIADLPSPL